MKRNRALQFDIKKAGASRAIYMDAETRPRMLLSLTDSSGQLIELEMNVDVAHSLLEQGLATYDLICPRVKRIRN